MPVQLKFVPYRGDVVTVEVDGGKRFDYYLDIATRLITVSILDNLANTGPNEAELHMTESQSMEIAIYRNEDLLTVSAPVHIGAIIDEDERLTFVEKRFGEQAS